MTSDVDTISQFVQWGGIMLMLSLLQIIGATAAMLVYSWQLTLVVWLVFAPMLVLAPRAQRALNGAYGNVRSRVGAMLAAVSESVVGAQTIRSYGSGDRVLRRVHGSIREHRDAAVRAQVLAAFAFSSGVLLAGVALAAVVTVGTLLGIAGQITAGGLLAFLFLVQIFTGPVQSATEVLNEMQNAVAGWRRVISVVHTPVDVSDPEQPVDLGPRRPAAICFDEVGFAYPGGPPVLRDVSLDIPAGSRVAIVGETGSGKTTLARLVTRFADPTHGTLSIDGVDLRDVGLADLRERVRGGAAGGVPVHGHHRLQRRLRPARGRRRAGRAGVRRAGPDRVAGHPPRRHRDRRRAARRVALGAASGSWWRSPVRTWPTPTSWSWTRRPPPSTPRPSRGSTERCRD